MKDLTKKELEALSAFLDGEGGDTEAVRNAIETDERLARRYGQYQALRTHLGALDKPELPAAFRTRVMASVRENEPEGKSWWSANWGLALTAAAAVVLVAGGVLFWPSSSVQAPSDGSNVTWKMATSVDPDALENVITERLEEIPDAQMNMLAMEFGTDVQAEEPADELSDTTDGATVLDQIDAVLDEQSDLDSVLATLNGEEAAQMKQLLAEYAKEG